MDLAIFAILLPSTSTLMLSVSLSLLPSKTRALVMRVLATGLACSAASAVAAPIVSAAATKLRAAVHVRRPKRMFMVECIQ